MAIDWGKEKGDGMYESMFEENKGVPNFPKKTEKEAVRDFETDAKNNPLLKRHGVKVMREEDYNKTQRKADFWKTFAIICGLALMVFLFTFGYMIYDGKLTPQFTDNSTQNINVESPTVPITNNYQHDISNNLTFNLDLGEDLKNTIANDIIDAVKNKLNESNITVN